jgi:hypothetical protein
METNRVRFVIKQHASTGAEKNHSRFNTELYLVYLVCKPEVNFSTETFSIWLL